MLLLGLANFWELGLPGFQFWSSPTNHFLKWAWNFGCWYKNEEFYFPLWKGAWIYLVIIALFHAVNHFSRFKCLFMSQESAGLFYCILFIWKMLPLPPSPILLVLSPLSFFPASIFVHSAPILFSILVGFFHSIIHNPVVLAFSNICVMTLCLRKPTLFYFSFTM